MFSSLGVIVSDMNRDRDITNVFIAKGVSRCVPGVRCVPGGKSIAIYKPDYHKRFKAINGQEPGQIWGIPLSAVMG